MNKLSENINKFPRQSAFLMLLLVILFPLGIYFYIQHKLFIDPLPLGSPIPSAVVATLDGKYVKIDSLIRKKSVLIFFATTCPHCKNELHIFDSLSVLFKNEFEIIVFSISSQNETKQFVEELKIPFRAYLDKTNDAKTKFRVRAIPAIFYINKKKQIVKYKAGEQGADILYSTLLKFASLTNDSILVL